MIHFYQDISVTTQLIYRSTIPFAKMRKMVIATLLLLSGLTLQAQNLSITDRSYFLGRDYYVLRSGNAKLIVQCDQADTGPAFTYLLFDAETPKQSQRKAKAFNYIPDKGFSSSALTVIMRNTRYTALGLNTITRWCTVSGIPSVEAVWWAGGIQVTEVITPVSLSGVFKRTITLKSSDLVADDTLSLQLSVPLPATATAKNALVCRNAESLIAVSITGNYPIQIAPAKESLTVGPLPIKIGEKKIIETYLALQTPATGAEPFCTRIANPAKWLTPEYEAVISGWSNSNTLTTRDTVVRNLFDNCRYILPGFVSDSGKMDAGIFEYGGQWVRDASNTALGVIHIGEFELARAILEHMLKNMITDNGTTMISSGFDNPDREQFDQMGEFIHVMKSYVDWTGDLSLLKDYSDKIVRMIERPLRPEFRDSTGMVHNRREFWERTFDDAYELAYQTWLVQGLRDAADLAKYLNSASKAAYWRAEADKTLNSMLNHPTLKLVDNGHLTKRRSTSGAVVDIVKFSGWIYGAPAGVERMSRLMPDASLALPITLGLVDTRSDLSKNTLTELEKLRNPRWSFGGYDRYHTSSQGDQPGPWTFATTFIMRAQHEAGELGRSRQSLEWLYRNAGGRTGAWFEEIPVISAQAETAGLLPWTSAEVSYFMIHHLMGIKFHGSQMVIKPALYNATGPLSANLRYKQNRMNIEISGSGPVSYALINGVKVNPNKNGEVEIPDSFVSGKIEIFCQ